MTDVKAAVEYARNNEAGFLKDLTEFIAIPSVSTSPEHKADVRAAAEWMAARLRALGMEKVELMPTGGHPVVYGEWSGAGKNRPTVLVYGHYDVQPVDPVELWATSPFDAVMKGDRLIGRGTSDMKGQVVASLKAVEALFRTGGSPVNLKWLIEGEEEIGSENLGAFIRANRELLKADICLNPDAGMIAADLPTVTYGLRGLCYMELRVHGPQRDLHSGLFGGVVHNPAQALSELIAGMHDERHRVTLPGFYDKVRTLSKKERSELGRLPTDDDFFLRQTGVPALWGEADFIPAERVGGRPTLEINGLLSGFTGTGSKTVLPAWAMAKISCRLVPDQTPEETLEQMRAYLGANAPKDIRWELTSLHHSGAALTDPNSAGVHAMSKAFETVWGKPVLLRREGGSIGAVVQLQEYVGVESVLTGFSLPEDNVHSPNESLHLPTWRRGIEALIHFFNNL